MYINLKKVTTPLALMGLMLATRFHHAGDSISLPDASLAAFFFAGLWVGGRKFFVLLLLEASLIDYVAITQFNVSEYCVSPAYAFLIPTYAALWFAGQYCTRFKTMKLTELMSQFGILSIATSVAFVISNASFYLFSGKFSDQSWVEYSSRVTQYYPSYVTATLVYAIVIFSIVKIINQLLSTSVQSTVRQG